MRLNGIVSKLISSIVLIMWKHDVIYKTGRIHNVYRTEEDRATAIVDMNIKFGVV